MNKAIVICDLKRIPKLLVGFLFVSLGLVFSDKSNLGMLPWGVFHSGISQLTGVMFGTVVQIVGVIVLAFSIIFVKVKPGIGTVLNIIFIGMIVNFINIMGVIKEYESLSIQISYLIVGIICSGFGTALYVSCKLGSGPRDGLFIGFSLITKLSVKYTKPMIEGIVLIVGFLLHGDFGIGTFVNAFISGFVTDFFFDVLKYNPKTSKQRRFIDYVTKGKVEKC
ncbi:MAG: hypothetical protein K0Q49_188 [Haloplasmataceae bacterium]|jgi:uncharacterized membrane protein YczE|nr:hypothetical protein [Haloplasmataceae bacterium]